MTQMKQYMFILHKYMYKLIKYILILIYNEKKSNYK